MYLATLSEVLKAVSWTIFAAFLCETTLQRKIRIVICLKTAPKELTSGLGRVDTKRTELHQQKDCIIWFLHYTF